MHLPKRIARAKTRSAAVLVVIDVVRGHVKGPRSLSGFQDLVWGRFWLTFGIPAPSCSVDLRPTLHAYHGHSACLTKIVTLKSGEPRFAFLAPSCNKELSKQDTFV